MSKNKIKKAVAVYNYKVIGASWYRDKKSKCVIFNAYDNSGMCHYFYIDSKAHRATRTMMTHTGLKLDDHDVSYMFWRAE